MKTLNVIVATLDLLLMPTNANAYHWQSPYAYFNKNPVRFIDPDGKDWYSSLDSIGSKNGQTIWGTQIHYPDYTSQDQMLKNNIDGIYLGKTVVVFDGYYDEANNGNLNLITIKPYNLITYQVKAKVELQSSRRKTK